MKIDELENPSKDVNMDLVVIYDRNEAKKHTFKDNTTRLIKTVIVKDIDSEIGKGPTALLDIWDDDIEKLSDPANKSLFQQKIRIINCYAKKKKTNRGEQFYINYGFLDGKKIGRYEKIE